MGNYGLQFFLKKYDGFMLPGILNIYRRIIISSSYRFLPTYLILNDTDIKHEFSCINGVEQDVMNLILNIKCIKFSLRNCSSFTLNIYKKGGCFLKASDFYVRGFCYILNPSLIISRIFYSFSISLTLNISKISSSSISDIKFPKDVIRIYSNSTSIERVSYGNNTCFSFLKVQTNGSISPVNCFLRSSLLLLSCFEFPKNSTSLDFIHLGFLYSPYLFTNINSSLKLNCKLYNFFCFTKVKYLIEIFLFTYSRLFICKPLSYKRLFLIYELYKLGYYLL
ncbi:hypothetical protein [Candidatus Vidania fulgoroideorum]